jgi:hypothetical protein
MKNIPVAGHRGLQLTEKYRRMFQTPSLTSRICFKNLLKMSTFAKINAERTKNIHFSRKGPLLSDKKGPP